MPNTILRVSGATAKIRRLLRQTKLTVVGVYWRNDPIYTHKPDGKRYETSGCNFLISSYDGTSFSTRVRLVTKFLREHHAEFLIIKELNVLPPLIDFGLYDDTPPGRMWPRYRLPASFLQLVSKFGFEIELSFYGRRDDDLAWLMTPEGEPVEVNTDEEIRQ